MQRVDVLQEQIPPAPLLQRWVAHCASARTLSTAFGDRHIVPGNDHTHDSLPRQETRRAPHRTCGVFRRDMDVSSKNPGKAADGSFGLDLSVFFGYFLCAKESNPRKARKPLIFELSAPSATSLNALQE